MRYIGQSAVPGSGTPVRLFEILEIRPVRKVELIRSPSIEMILFEFTPGSMLTINSQLVRQYLITGHGIKTSVPIFGPLSIFSIQSFDTLFSLSVQKNLRNTYHTWKVYYWNHSEHISNRDPQKLLIYFSAVYRCTYRLRYPSKLLYCNLLAYLSQASSNLLLKYLTLLIL